MQRLLIVTSIAMAGFLLPPDAHAQFNGFRGVELWGGWASWAGEDAEGLEPGFRGGAIIFNDASSRLGVGLEGMYGSMSLDGGDVDEWGAGLVLRWSAAERTSTHLFVGGRLGWHRLSTEVSLVEIDQDGFAIGPEVGAEIPISTAMSLVLAAEGTWQTYGNARLFATSEDVADTAGSAFRLGVRAGILFGGGS